MIKMKTIVVATDLSELSIPAVHHAADIARRFGGALHVVSIVPYPFTEFLEQCQKDFGQSMDECEKRYFCEWEQSLNELEIPGAPDNVTRVALKGFTVDRVLEYLREQDADLLVVGTHGYTGLKHILMGSTAEALVRQATCPVLTVRDQKTAAAAA